MTATLKAAPGLDADDYAERIADVRADLEACNASGHPWRDRDADAYRRYLDWLGKQAAKCRPAKAAG